MQKIVIRYVQIINNSAAATLSVLGCEIFDDVCEALVPTVDPNSKSFIVKRFDSSSNYRWDVEQVVCTSTSGAIPVTYDITLSSFNHSKPVVYLSTTRRKTSASLNKIIRPFSLVEVEYGFFQSVVKDDGRFGTNKRYSNTLQHGEMRKRRLAVVVKINQSSLQVVPVTCDDNQSGNKSVIELMSGTLSKLDFYGRGKRSFALCDMIETVSPNRIFPPAQVETKIRSTAYSLRLSKPEIASLTIALIHSAGYTKYLEDVKKIAYLEHSVAQLKSEVDQLKIYKALAEILSTDLASDLDSARAIVDEEARDNALAQSIS